MFTPTMKKITVELDVERDGHPSVHTITIPFQLDEEIQLGTVRFSMEFLGDVISTLNANGVRARVE